MGNSSSKGRPASCDCDEEENVELNNVITEPSIKRPVLLRQKSDQKSTNIPNTKKIKSDPHRKLIVDELQSIFKTWTVTPKIQTFEILEAHKFSLATLRELLWSLKKCHRTFSLLEDVFIDSRSEIKDKWLKLESPAKLFFNHAFLSILQLHDGTDEQRKSLQNVINEVKKELIRTKGFTNAKNGCVQLMIKGLGFKVLTTYKLTKNRSIFKLIFDNINKKNAYQMIEIIKEFLGVLTYCGEKQIEDLKEYEIDHLLEIKLDKDIKVRVLRNFVQYWKVNGAASYQELRSKMIEFPELKILILVRENNVSEFYNHFDEYLFLLNKTCKATIKKKTFKIADVNGVPKKSQVNETEDKFDKSAYYLKLSDDCLMIANICYMNRNEEILQKIIAEHKIDQEVESKKLIIKLIVFLCKVGFHESLQKCLDKVDSVRWSVRNAKEIMFNVFDRMMENYNHKSFQEVYFDKINHNLCFKMIVNYRGIKKFNFVFMKYALLYGYDEIVLQLFKNGYYIDSKNEKNESFLTICKNPDLLRRVLDNSVTIYHDNNAINKKCLKIDYSFLLPPVDVEHNKKAVRIHVPLQKIARNVHFKNLIEHPVLATCINFHSQKLKTLHHINFWLFLLSWLVLIISVVPYGVSNDLKLKMYLVCPMYVVIREAIQVYIIKVEYFKYFANWIEMVLISFGVAGYLGLFLEDKTMHHLCSAILIMLTVVELLLLKAKMSRSWYQMLSMLIKVATTYMKIIKMFSLIFIGFPLSFYLIFLPENTGCGQSQNITENPSMNNFYNYPFAFLKTSVMLTGEFDASSISLDCWYRKVFFVIFVFIAVTIFNFMNAIAIGEVQKLEKDAEFLILNEKLVKIAAYKKLFDKFESWRPKSCQTDVQIFKEIFIECTGLSVRLIHCNKTDELMKIDEEMCYRLQEIAKMEYRNDATTNNLD